MLNLKNKVALITGATGGIGKEIAKDYAKQGASIALMDLNKEQLEKFKEELLKSFDIKIKTYQVNATNKEEVLQLIKDVEADFKSLDILVNCAGITRDNLAMRIKDEDWQSVIDINLTAVFRLSRAVLRGMMKRKIRSYN